MGTEGRGRGSGTGAKSANAGKRGAHGGNPRGGRRRAQGAPGTRGQTGATLAFVYGSLLKGLENHRLLDVPGARLVAAGVWTEPGYELRDLGAYPGMARGGAGAVIGEVYEVDEATLAALDHLEGHPRFYTRSSIALRGFEPGAPVEAYLLGSEKVIGTPLVLSGDWRAHFRARG